MLLAKPLFSGSGPLCLRKEKKKEKEKKNSCILTAMACEFYDAFSLYIWRIKLMFEFVFICTNLCQ